MPTTLSRQNMNQKIRHKQWRGPWCGHEWRVCWLMAAHGHSSATLHKCHMPRKSSSFLPNCPTPHQCLVDAIRSSMSIRRHLHTFVAAAHCARLPRHGLTNHGRKNRTGDWRWTNNHLVVNVETTIQIETPSHLEDVTCSVVYDWESVASTFDGSQTWM